MDTTVTIEVNGQVFRGPLPVNLTLLEFLRDHLGLKGAKEGCGSGDCGACTVLLDDRPVNSCLVLAVEADGARVVTIEGLAPEGQLSELQQSFLEHGAVQCGYCSPGMIITARGLLMENPRAGEEEVKRAIAGNICRCTGYQRIVRAIVDAGGKMSSRDAGPK